MTMANNNPNDWGISSNSGNVEIIKAVFPHKRDERRSQLIALVILSILSFVLVVVDAIAKTSFSKEILVVVLPAFTFVLGRMDRKSPGE